MTPEEKTIQRMRRRGHQTGKWVMAIILWACLLVVQIVLIAKLHERLDEIHDYVREQTNHSVLSDLLVEQSRLEMAISWLFAALLAYAVLIGFLIGKFATDRGEINLTITMWDRIQHLEREILLLKQADSGSSSKADT